MKTTLVFLTLLVAAYTSKAQKIDSICFHLYTDSLKKGTHNYINVDARLSNGSWRPLTADEIRFSSSACSFSGNELIVPADFAGEKITVKAVLKSDSSRAIETTIWIKKLPDPSVLPTHEEILNRKEKKKSGKKDKKSGSRAAFSLL